MEKKQYNQSCRVVIFRNNALEKLAFGRPKSTRIQLTQSVPNLLQIDSPLSNQSQLNMNKIRSILKAPKPQKLNARRQSMPYYKHNAGPSSSPNNNVVQSSIAQPSQNNRSADMDDDHLDNIQTNESGANNQDSTENLIDLFSDHDEDDNQMVGHRSDLDRAVVGQTSSANDNSDANIADEFDPLSSDVAHQTIGNSSNMDLFSLDWSTFDSSTILSVENGAKSSVDTNSIATPLNSQKPTPPIPGLIPASHILQEKVSRVVWTSTPASKSANNATHSATLLQKQTRTLPGLIPISPHSLPSTSTGSNLIATPLARKNIFFGALRYESDTESE